MTDGAQAAQPDGATVTVRLPRWSDPRLGERKLVTVLFVDVVHSSDIVADSDPEDSNDILLPVVQGFADVVRSVGGTVAQMLGDGIMAVFGAPAALEDHALRACYAAEKIRSLARSGRVVGAGCRNVSLQVRIGISSGEVVTQVLHPDRWAEHRSAGEAVYFASRMEKLAKPNGIWVTDDTIDLVGGNAVVRRIGTVSLAPGSTGKVIFELIGLSGARPAPMSSLAQRPSRTFGRTDELAYLSQRLAGARDGVGNTVLISGDAGIGKSRLVEELVAMARTWQFRVAAVASAPPGFSSPNGDLAALVRELFGVSEAIEGPSAVPVLGGTLGEYGLGGDDRIADLALALGAVSGATPERFPNEHFERSVSLLSDAVVAISQERAVLLVCEDGQWASSTLRRFITDVARRTSTCPVMLVVTSRSPLGGPIAELPTTSGVALQALPDDSSRSLLSDFLGDGRDLKALMELVVRRAQGNPLFLTEFASALVQDGTVRGSRGDYRLVEPLADLTVPATIQGILAARLDSLRNLEKSILMAASVIGPSFDVGLLAELADVSRDELLVVLKRLHAMGFVEQTRTLPSIEFSFRHALIHDVAYRTLLKKRRREMHGRLIAQIRRRPASLIFGKTELLADHAYRSEQWLLSCAWNRRAGRNAQEKSWNIEAERFFRHALESLDHLPQTPKNTLRRLDLVACQVRSLFALGRNDDARDQLDAVTSRPTLGDAGRVGCEIASLSVLYHWFESSLSEAETAAQAANEIAGKLDDIGLQVSCAFRLGVILVDKGEFGRGLDLLVSAAKSIPNQRRHDTFGLMAVGSVACRVAAARCLAETGAFDEAIRLSYQAIEIADEAKHVFSQIYANLAGARVMIRARYSQESLPFLDRALTLSEISRFWLVQPLISGFIGVAKVLTGSVEDGLHLLNETADAAEFPSLMVRHSTQRAWRAEGFLAAGFAEQAHSIGSVALATAHEKGEKPTEALCLRIVGESRIHMAGAADPDGLALIERARALAQDLAMRPLEAQCDMAIARLSHLAGRHGEAEERFKRAANAFLECGMKPPSTAEAKIYDSTLAT